MKSPIYPCLWFDGQAKAAAEFYCSVFNDAQIVADTPMVVNFRVSGQKFMCLNGGPHYKIGPAISFFVMCETSQEVDEVWRKLLEGGSVMMALDKYDWSEKYGWLQDQFGVSWQVALGKLSEVGQKCTPSLLFTGKQHGRAEEALNFYTKLFPGSSVDGMLRYGVTETEKEGSVQHAQFRAGAIVMMVMDSAHPHAFGFNEAVSFVIECETQEEIDHYWEKLTEAGGEEGRCGWLKDRFGVSWQVIPAELGSLLGNPEKGDRAVTALMQMNKLDIEKLRTA